MGGGGVPPPRKAQNLSVFQHYMNKRASLALAPPGLNIIF